MEGGYLRPELRRPARRSRSLDDLNPPTLDEIQSYEPSLDEESESYYDSESEYSENTIALQEQMSAVPLRHRSSRSGLRRTPKYYRMVPTAATLESSTSSVDLLPPSPVSTNSSPSLRQNPPSSRKARWARAKTFDVKRSKLFKNRRTKAREGQDLEQSPGTDPRDSPSGPPLPVRPTMSNPLIYPYSVDQMNVPKELLQGGAPASPFRPREPSVTQWNETDVSKLLRTLPADHRKRYRIAHALYESERQQSQQLDILVNQFLLPLRVKVSVAQAAEDEATDQEKALYAEQPLLAFGNIEVLRHLTARCVEALAERIHPATWSAASTLGDLLCTFFSAEEFIRIYHTFAHTYERNLHAMHVAAAAETTSQFGAFLRQEQFLAGCVCVGELMQAPMRRMAQYQRFLEDLVDATPSIHRDRSLLNAALENARSFDASLQTVRWRQGPLYFEELKKKCMDVGITLDVPGRQLLVQGEVRKFKRSSDFQWLFVFTDVMICVSNHGRGASKMKIQWVAGWSCSTVELISSNYGDAISVRGTRPIEEEPYLIEEQHMILPSNRPPYEMEFWRDALFRPPVDHSASQRIQGGAALLKHLHDSFFGPTARLMVSVGAEESEFTRGEQLYGRRVPTSIHLIRSGVVRIEKCVCDHEDGEEDSDSWSVVGLATEGDFLGEAAYLLNEAEYYHGNAQLRYVAHSEEVSTTEINHSLLDYIFTRNSALEPRFLRVLCYRLAHFSRPLGLDVAPLPSLPVFPRKLNSLESRYKEKQQLESKLAKVLPETDTILARYPCKLKRDLRTGLLIVLKESLVLLPNTFLNHGAHHVLIEYTDIQEMRPADRALEIVWNSPDHDDVQETLLTFPEASVAEEVHHVLVALTRDNSSDNRDEFFVHSMSSHSNVDKELSEEDLELIFSFGEKRSFPVGSAVFEQGQFEIPLCYLRQGRVTLSRAFTSYGKEEFQGLGIRAEGEFFGELPFFLQGPSPYEVVALEEGSMQTFHAHALQTMEHKHPELAARFYRQLAIFLTRVVRQTESRL